MNILRILLMNFIIKKEEFMKRSELFLFYSDFF